MAGIVFTEASGVADSVFGKCQAPIRLMVESRGEAMENLSMLKEVYCMENSKNFGEHFTTMTAMSGFSPVGEGGSSPFDSMMEGYSKTLQHTTWANKFAVSKEMIEDSKTIDLSQRPEAFMTSYHRTRESFGAALIGGAIQKQSSVTYAGKSFDITAADGQPLFSKVHPSKLGKGNQSNLFADTFSNDALMALESKMQDFRGDSMEVLDVAPNCILIPNNYALKKSVFAAIGADKDPNTANNGFNFTFGRWKVLIWNYLNQFVGSDTAPWILLDQNYNKAYRSAVWLDRVKLELNSVIDHETNSNVFYGRGRWSAGFNDWRGFAVGGVTGGDTLIAG